MASECWKAVTVIILAVAASRLAAEITSNSSELTVVGCDQCSMKVENDGLTLARPTFSATLNRD